MLDPGEFIELAQRQTWQLILLGLFVFALTKMLGKNRPHLTHVLWLAVLIKCLVPPIIVSPMGVFCWLGSETTQSSLSAPQPQKLADNDVFQHRNQHDLATSIATNLSLNSATQNPEFQRSIPASAGSVRNSTPMRLLYVWVLGAVVVGILSTYQVLNFLRRIRTKSDFDATTVHNLVGELSRQLSIRRNVRLHVTKCRVGPAVYGLIRPTIVLPELLVANWNVHDLRPLLAHELIHIRRGDLWVNLLQSLSKAVWWFNPLVWMACQKISQTTETCCDEQTVASLACSPKAYAQSLLRVLELKRTLYSAPAFPGVRPVEVTATRLEKIMNLEQGCCQQTPFWCWATLATLLFTSVPGAIMLAQDTPLHTDTETKDASIAAPKDNSSVFLEPVGVNPNIENLLFDTKPTISIETKLIRAARSAVNVEWKVLNRTENESSSSAPSFANLPIRSVARGSVSKVEETRQPVEYALLPPVETETLLDTFASDSQKVVATPKITIQDGQTASLIDGKERAFVVGLQKEQRLQFLNEGVTIHCRAHSEQSTRIWTELDLTYSTVKDDANASSATAVSATLAPQTHVRTSLDLSLEIPVGQTLVVCLPNTQSHPTEELLVLLTPTLNSPKVRSDRQPKFESIWDLSLQESVRLAVKNSKAIRAHRPVRQEGPDRLVLTTQTGVRTELEFVTIDVAKETATAYWELRFFYENLAAAKIGRDVALNNWKTVYAKSITGSPNIEPQFREQYFFFRSRVEEGLRDLYTAEARLRHSMGIARGDGRLTRPMDDPSEKDLRNNWEELHTKALAHSSNLNRQKRNVAAREMELAAHQNAIRPMNEQLNAFGADVPVGMRREIAAMRKAELMLDREKARLQDVELETSHQLTDSVAELESQWMIRKTHKNRLVASDAEQKAMKEAFNSGTVTADRLLDAGRRSADAKVAYWQSSIEHELCHLKIQELTGEFLADVGIEVTDE